VEKNHWVNINEPSLKASVFWTVFSVCFPLRVAPGLHNHMPTEAFDRAGNLRSSSLLLSLSLIQCKSMGSGVWEGKQLSMSKTMPLWVAPQTRLSDPSFRPVSSDQMEIIDTTQIQPQIDKQPKGKGTAVAGPRPSTNMQLHNSFITYYFP
jgi:hypothetical protein